MKSGLAPYPEYCNELISRMRYFCSMYTLYIKLQLIKLQQITHILIDSLIQVFTTRWQSWSNLNKCGSVDKQSVMIFRMLFNEVLRLLNNEWNVSCLLYTFIYFYSIYKIQNRNLWDSILSPIQSFHELLFSEGQQLGCFKMHLLK